MHVYIRGYIVTTTQIEAINDIIWGGRVKDIKRRPTKNYLFATCGKNEIRLWALNPSNGKLLSDKCHTTIKREYTCLSFSKTGDILVVGTMSGDFFVINVRKLNIIGHYTTCVYGIRKIYIEMMNNSDNVDYMLNEYLYIKIVCFGGDGSVSEWIYNDDLEKYLLNNKINIYNNPISSVDVNDCNFNIIQNNGSIYNIPIKFNENDYRNKPNIPVKIQSESEPIIGVKFVDPKNNDFITCAINGSLKLSHNNICIYTCIHNIITFN